MKGGPREQGVGFCNIKMQGERGCNFYWRISYFMGVVSPVTYDRAT